MKIPSSGSWLLYLLLGGPFFSFTMTYWRADQRRIILLGLYCSWGMLSLFLFKAGYLPPMAVPLVLFTLTGGAVAIRERLRIYARLKMSEERLNHQAFHDALTGLPNRALFLERLECAIARANQHSDKDDDNSQDARSRVWTQFAVLFLDLDRFKVVNDSLGHSVGDRLLVAIAHRLVSCLRPTDTLARLGGDEFTILLDDIQDISDATRIAQQVLEALKSPFRLNGLDVFTTASIGIAFAGVAAEVTIEGATDVTDKLSGSGVDKPSATESAAALLRDADIAMYQAKAQGKARYAVFDATLHFRAKALLQLETDLRRAVGDLPGDWGLAIADSQPPVPQFRIYYQPIVSLKTGKIAGFEALVRWQHPQRGLVSPIEFIPLAEETRLIACLDEWVLRESCQQLRVWQGQFGTEPPLTMSVNLSGVQFSQSGLSEQIDRVLRETGLESSSLKLEITETCLIDNTREAIALLEQFRALGIKVGIDDFGIGYSSLGRLHLMPVDTLKIDRSFISGMGDASGGGEIVRTIVNLAHNLNMDVVAEGVETAEQMVELKRLQCDCGQGYFFSKPVDASAAEALMAQEPQW